MLLPKKEFWKLPEPRIIQTLFPRYREPKQSEMAKTTARNELLEPYRLRWLSFRPQLAPLDDADEWNDVDDDMVMSLTSRV